MDGTLQINNCGVYTKVSRRKLCGMLLKNGPRYYSNYPIMFNTDIDLLISKLQEVILIQIYKTGVVRLFFDYKHFEKRYAIYLELSKETLDILRNIK